MRNFLCRLTSIILFAAAAEMGAHAQSAPMCTPRANLVANASFEQGNFSSSGFPDWWSWDAFSQSATHVWDDSEARTGGRSVKISAPSPNDARWVQNLPVNPNEPYYLSAWIKTQDVAHSDESSDIGANISLLGTWTHSPALIGTQDWTRTGVLFNSGPNDQVTVSARLGFWSGTTTGTAWFDDISLAPVVPTEPHPSWKVLVLIYRNTDFIYTDNAGIEHHVVASMSNAEVIRAADSATKFAQIDIPALTSGNMVPAVTIRYPDRALTELSPNGEGWWPSPGNTAPERDASFDSVIVIWDPRTTDITTGNYIWIGSAAGLTPAMGMNQTYTTMIIEAAAQYGHRNVFKHEFGHSLLEFFDAIGTAPKPKVANHTDATQYVNCVTGQPYVWRDETTANPIPNSIYNNDSGFTHDYYSGTTAAASAPTQCLGITAEAWAYGGPVSNSGNNAPFQIVNDRVDFVVQDTSFDPAPVTGGPAGTMTISTILTNKSSDAIWDSISAIVKTLTNGNRLLSAADGNGGAGSTQDMDIGGGGELMPGESLTAQFRIGLASRSSFQFLVDVQGCVPSQP